MFLFSGNKLNTAFMNYKKAFYYNDRVFMCQQLLYNNIDGEFLQIICNISKMLCKKNEII